MRMSDSSEIILWVIFINIMLFLCKFSILVVVFNIMNIKPLAVLEGNSYRQIS